MSKWERFVFGSDNHGDMVDSEAKAAFLKFVEDFKPKHRVHGGDNFDFRPLRKKACEEERRESMVKDFNAGMRFLKEYKPTHFLRGNHDERLFDLAHEDRGIISDFALQGCQEIRQALDKMNCRMLPYNKFQGVLRIGRLKMIHGFLAGITAARRTALAFGSVLMGHGHSIDYACIEGLDRRMGRMCGCLCKLDMDYNRAQIGAMRHAHGWAYGVINRQTGLYIVRQAEKVGSDWSCEIL